MRLPQLAGQPVASETFSLYQLRFWFFQVYNR